MSSPMNTLLLGLTMYDTLLIVTSVLMVGVPSIHTHSSYLLEDRDSDIRSTPQYRAFSHPELFSV